MARRHHVIVEQGRVQHALPHRRVIAEIVSIFRHGAPLSGSSNWSGRSGRCQFGGGRWFPRRRNAARNAGFGLALGSALRTSRSASSVLMPRRYAP